MTTCYFCRRELRTVVTVWAFGQSYDCGRACARDFITVLRGRGDRYSVDRWRTDGQSAAA